MSQVVLERAVKRYGSLTALEALDLTIQEGEFLTLLGPSGCGKTTTLRLIAGFLEPSEGRILIDGEDVTQLPPQKRQIGMVFQDYALFPHLSIAENIGFGLRERRYPKDRIKSRVAELLDLIQLPDVADRYPAQLSGGQRQRVALARAVAHPPRVLLMDEPLGALDLKLRESMQVELRRIQKDLGITTVYVTHDQIEAMTMSDRIAVMNEGRLIQLGEPGQVYRQPRTRFVANFVGKINLLVGRVLTSGGAGHEVGSGPYRFRITGDGGTLSPDSQITLALRPEHLEILRADAPDDGRNRIEGRITEATYTGNLVHVMVEDPEGTKLLVECRPEDDLPKLGDSVAVAWSPERAVVLED